MTEQEKCPLCGSAAYREVDYHQMLVFYACSLCGRYQIGEFYHRNKLNRNHLASYLLYHCYRRDLIEYRYHTVLDKETCDKYRQEFEKGNNTHGRPVHMDDEIIESWYPKTFSERIDRILLFLNSRIKHVGQQISMGYQELISALFVDRKELDESKGEEEWVPRKDVDCEREVQYMLNYLVKSLYIEYESGADDEEWVYLSLLPGGYARIDELQKYSANGRNVLVAMKFGSETIRLREAIRKGIYDASYYAIFIDEVQHNDFITPELLRYIRDSKFVVVDLTHQNNGAYFEEGYAMGLGKPVIQLCKADTKLHFDIAQKNTIMWQTEDEIPTRLCNRIIATID